MLVCLWSPKGGSGTSVFAAACALALARDGGARLADLRGDQPAILGLGADEFAVASAETEQRRSHHHGLRQHVGAGIVAQLLWVEGGGGVIGGPGQIAGERHDLIVLRRLHALVAGHVELEPADGLPYIGKYDDHAWVATGFSGDGMTNGTLAAMLLSQEILGWAGQVDLSIERGTW